MGYKVVYPGSSTSYDPKTGDPYPYNAKTNPGGAIQYTHAFGELELQGLLIERGYTLDNAGNIIRGPNQRDIMPTKPLPTEPTQTMEIARTTNNIAKTSSSSFFSKYGLWIIGGIVVLGITGLALRKRH